MTGPANTADDLWGWLLACLDCGQAHEYRGDPCHHGHDVKSWAADDGHAYRIRLMGCADRLHQLRAKWEASP